MTPEHFETEKTLSEKKKELLSLLLAEQGLSGLPKRLISYHEKKDGLPIPLAYEQEQLWFLAQLEPTSSFYNVPLVLRLEGPLNTSALQASLNALVERHESLHTCFRAHDGRPFQVIVPARPLPLPILDLSALPTAEQQTLFEQASHQEADALFDLERGPLLRARLVRFGSQNHCLLLTLHHIIFDGWSQGILLRELSMFYSAIQADTVTNLPTLPIQYADYAWWQREWLQGETLTSELAYWQGEVAGAPTQLELPTDHPRAASPGFEGTALPFTLPAELTAHLKAFARQEGCTLYMLMLAGLEVVLSRYSEQDDFLLGTAVAHRPSEETEGLIGMLVNTLVLRADVQGQPTGRELLRRVRERVLSAQTHRGLPLEKLVEAINPERQGNATPLVQVAIAWEEKPSSVRELGPGLVLRVEPWTSRAAKYELTCVAWEEDATVRGVVEYNTALYKASTVERLMGHWQQVLEGLIAQPGVHIGQLPLLTAAEREQILITWNATQATYPHNRCIYHLFAEQAARTPEAIALVHSEKELTYQELLERSAQLAHTLRGYGVGPEVCVALYLERSFELIIGILGTLLAGGAFVPIDPTYPIERIAYLLEDAHPALLLTQSSLSDNLRAKAVSMPLLCLDSDWTRMVAFQPISCPVTDVTPLNLAYVIYTSGSTGTPKGVQVPHRGILNIAQYQQHTFAPGPGKRVLQFAALGFDGAIFELICALLSGAALVLAPREQLLPGSDLLNLLAEQRITTSFMPPSALATLAAFSGEDSSTPELMPTVETLLVAGEACPASVVTRWAPGRRLFNLYGPAEITISATTAICAPDGASPPIGRPIINTQVYVLNDQLELVPVGVTGELYIGGVGVARGYLNRPDLTAERFIPSSFSQTPGERLYRTGDRVRWRSDGQLEFLGRRDHQIKLRGFRIELEEIEAVLNQHVGVREAIVLLRKNHLDTPYLVAYILPGEPAPTLHELRNYLRARLPEYMLPAAFVWLDALPLTPNGKVDRRALPSPDWERTLEIEQEQAPQTGVEKALAEIWTEILGISQVSRQANFFEIGGHSLLATQLISRVRSHFQIDLPVRTIFEEQTLAGLARCIEKTRPMEQASSTLPLRSVPRQGNLPLSFAQERLWFLDQLVPNNTAYIMPFAFSLKGPLHLEILQQSFNEIVKRHESLRTTFVAVQGRPVQIIRATLSLNLPVINLEGMPEQERAAEVRQRATTEAQQPFDLARDPLLRVTLLRLGAEEHILLLTMHHIISDGWSISILLKELAALYTAFSAGQSSPLKDLPLHYADYVGWQREWLQGEALEAQLAYWKQQLADRPAASELPIDYPRPASQTFRGAYQSLAISRVLTEKLKALSQEEGGTLFMTLLGAFSLLLARFSGQDEFLIGTPIAGRTRSEVEGLIGLFLNTLVLRVNLKSSPTFRELVGRVREVTLGAYAHQDLPFEQLVEALHPERDLSRNPLFEIMMNLTNMPKTTLELPELAVNNLEVIEPEAKFSMTLYIEERAGELLLQLVYQRDLFSGKRMHLFLQQFQYLLEQITENPEQSIDVYSLVTPESRFLLPDPTEILPEPYYEPVTSMITSWAVRTPDAPAICQAENRWSYRELVEKAEAIARALVACGVKRGDVVAVSGSRSFGLIASVVGVLMSRAAFLTLDRALPARRKQIMIEQGGAKYLVKMADRRVVDPEEEDLSSLETIVVNPLSGCVVDEMPWVDQQAIQLPTLLPDDAAYLIFTSGTTGVPKGVLGCHKGLSHFLTWQRATFAMAPGDSSAQLTGISFDMVLRDIFFALVSGATLYLPEEDIELVPSKILPWLARERITTLHIVPTLAQTWLSDAPEGVSLPALRRVFFAGEPLTGILVRRWREVFGVKGEIVNLYGPTETTQSKCYYRVPIDVQPGVQPVGWPLPETQVLVLGKENQICGIGEPGEIVIRTPFRTLGYINVPEENRQRFVKNPFRDDDRDIVYYSGDRGRYALDGKLEILGRIDHQVKIRGIRIELREIEVALMQHPAVQDAAVILHESRPAEGSSREDQRDKRLLAFFVPVSAHQPLLADTELRNFLQTWLPTYMIPSDFIMLPALPLTLNGKLDRRALPIPKGASRGSEHYRSPRTPTEELVAGIWAQVLKQEWVGVHDNFFALGGHSLLGVQIISRLRDTFQVELPLRALFEAPTIASLAQRIENMRLTEKSPQALPIARVDRQSELPLSFTQQRLWFLDRWEPNNPFFNISRTLAIRGPLVVEALEQSLNEIIRRHEALRTTIVAVQGRPRQIIAPELQLILPVVDLSTIPGEAREAEVQQRARTEARQPFDLSRGLLIRATLLRLHETEHVLLLTLHHIISDAWSIGILLQELGVLYDTFVQGSDTQNSPLPELPVQYVDFAVWQREKLQSRLRNTHTGEFEETLMEQQLSYWREHLSGAPPLLALPTDLPRPPKQTFRGKMQHFAVPQTLANGLKALSQREGVTLFMTLLAAFQTLLFRYTGQEDLVVGATNANRTRSEIENLIGCFFDIQALRTDLSGNPTFLELLGRVREVTLGAYANQDLPFGKVVEELQPERSLSHSPIFQVAFALQHAPVMTLELTNLTLSLLEVDTGSARLDLMIFLADSEQRLIGTVEYNTDLFEASTIARFVEHYQQLLESIVTHPEQDLASLSFLSHTEREQLLGEWSKTAVSSLPAECLQKIFAGLLGEPTSREEQRGQGDATLQTYLLDAYMHPVPVGIPGELYIDSTNLGSTNLTHGYLNDSGLRVEQFLPHPFSDAPGARLYRTRALARYHSTGTIEYLGQVDQQVVLRGYRIRLSEIESTLAQHAGLQESVVVLREDTPSEMRLVAYVVPNHVEQQLSGADLRHFLEKRLPDYMVPTSFVVLYALPRTLARQIDRSSLPRPEERKDSPAGARDMSRTSIEAALIEIWSELLDLEQIADEPGQLSRQGIDIHEDFFALGGHSLLATQVMSRVQEIFQVELPLHVFFEASTIAEQAERIDLARQAAQELHAPPLIPASRTGPLPLSFAQERLWFLEQLASDNTAYTILAARRVRNHLDISALERSLALLAQRHEALRTTIVMGEDGPVQIIAPRLDIPLLVSDLKSLPEEDREAEIQRLASQEMLTSFDLSRGPLLRVRLLLVDEQNYVLLITVHHIASDGWSQGILYRELTAFYTALCEGRHVSLPRLPIQYADYALWQRSWLQGKVLEEQVAYWRERLAGAPSILELPTDHPRPPVQSFSGAIHPFSLPASLTGRLRALSLQEGATLFMTLLAAFQLLLHRYSGQEDLVIGTPIANRTHREIEGLIGFFVNTLVLRTDLTDDPPFLTLLERVREVCLGAYAHQELPFEKLVEALQPERSLSHNPLFQVFFALQNMELDEIVLPGATVEPLVIESPIAKFDLSLYLREDPEGELHGAIEYSTDLFEAETIGRLVEHYWQLLERIVANPERRISQLPLLSEKEWEQIIWYWNATEEVSPREACLPQLFEEQARRTPEAIAVLSQEHQITYRELEARANQLAHYLRDLGIGPETRVGVCLEPSVAMVIGILGILKAGGVYLPLDPSYPLERLSFMLQDSQTPVVLTETSLLAQLPSRTTRLLCLDADWKRIAQCPTSSPGTRVYPENLAYVIYTSGSTGQPKGVLATHRATVNRLNWMWRAYPFTCDEICCQKTSLSFVDAVWEILGPLLQGIPTVFIPKAQLQDLRELIETLASKEITRIVLVPSLLQALLNVEDNLQERLPKLTFWITSGEALSPDLLKHFQKALPTRRLLNLYGSSEVAGDATCYDVPLQSEVGTNVPIGRPIANTQAYILDTHLRPVPVGGQGELYIGGTGVARGYLNRPDLTAERFIPHPFSKEPGERLYRTGDRARYLPTGEIEFLGRTDYQVKIRGFRIEMGEVEAILSQHPLVNKTVVLAREDVPGEKRLVAYVIPTQEAPPSLQDLRRYLQEHLPEYLLPSAFVFLEEMPLLTNGKINRQALPAPQRDRASLEALYMGPRTPIEETLVAIWAEVLRLEQVGVYDNFFELGGDSILTIQVVTRALRAGLQVTPKHLFQYQTIAELAKMVEMEKQEAVSIQRQEGQPAVITPKTGSSEQVARDYTPADFPLADLDKEEFNKLAGLLSKITRSKESPK